MRALLLAAPDEGGAKATVLVAQRKRRAVRKIIMLSCMIGMVIAKMNESIV
jgi:hypothetical protein